MRRRAAPKLIATGCLLVGGCGGAAVGDDLGPPSPAVQIQAIFDTRGNPSLVANFVPDGGLAKARWSICADAQATTCRPTRHRVLLRPGPSAAGTVFEATATHQGRRYTARTAPWRGTVRATAPPRLEGKARVGATVTPVGGRWAGGWGSEFDLLRVQACRTVDAHHCVTLSRGGDGYHGGRRSAVVGGRYAGWYLFAVDQRLAQDTAFGEPGYASPEAIPPLEPGPTVSRSAAVGPVTR